MTLLTAVAGFYAGTKLARYWQKELQTGSPGNRNETAAGSKPKGRNKEWETRDMGELKLDPKAGVYRPIQH